MVLGILMVMSHAVRRRPLPTSLIVSSNFCSARFNPPTKKHIPRHRRRVARMEPRIAAWMTENLFSDRRTIKRTISTIDPIVEFQD